MKVLVAVKRVLDHATRARISADGTSIDLANGKMIVNPFDEIALEEAIRLRERGTATSVTVVSCGSASTSETLRTALAMGADRAIHVHTDIELPPLTVAKLINAVAARELPQLIILGKQAIDDDSNQTGQMIAALADLPQATFASKIEPSNGTLVVTREVDGGLETIRITLPAVVTVDLRLNEPRYITLPNILKAKKKPLETLTPADLGVDVSSRIRTVRISQPPRRRGGIKVPDVATLIDKLRNEARVI
jgi:electron transfer flavoprotein beta subunit